MATVAMRLRSGDEIGAGLRICGLGIGLHIYAPHLFSPFLLISLSLFFFFFSLTKCCPKLPSQWASGYPLPVNPFRGLEGDYTY